MPKVGLRLQLVLALTVAFVGAFTLLGFTAVQLSQRGRDADRVGDAEATAHAMAAGLATVPSTLARRRFVQVSDAVLGRGGVRGVEWRRGEREDASWVRGVTGLGEVVEVPLVAGTTEGRLRLFVRPPEHDQGPFSQLMLMYVAITGGVILLLTYLALTVLIVRPVDTLRAASERMARGNLEVEAPVGGAREVARLSQAFNAMAARVRDDQRTLEAQLREVEQKSAALATAQEQVLRSAKLASVGRLAAGVAHEIGNPLTAVLGLVEIARDEDDPETRAEFLDRIQKETERIHGIIRDLLAFARDGSDAAASEAAGDADLAEVVADAIQLVAPQKDASKLRIEQRLAKGPRVRGQHDRLTQVLLNLLLNAADAVDGDGDIVVELARDGDHAVLSVTDTGTGIPEDLLDQIFEPFVTSKPVGQGTGLGLAVSHTIIDRLGGTLRAENAEGGGARFEIRLPHVRA